MLTDERLKEMRNTLDNYPPVEIYDTLHDHVAELLDEIERLKVSITDSSPDGMTALARHIEQGVVVTVLRTETGDTVTTFRKVKI